MSDPTEKFYFPIAKRTLAVNVMTAFCFILVFVIIVGTARIPKAPVPIMIVADALIVGAFYIAWLFVPTGFTVIPRRRLEIHRRIGTLTVELDRIRDVRLEPNVMRWAIKTCGNNGFFCTNGYFYNKRLGSFRAYVTDHAKSIVVQTIDRNYVISPDDPDVFLKTITPLIAAKTNY